MFSPFCFLKNQFFCISTYLFSSFLFKFISPAYKYTFISVNHIICNIGCLKQTGKRIIAVTVILSLFYLFIFFFIFLNARKLNFIQM